MGRSQPYQSCQDKAIRDRKYLPHVFRSKYYIYKSIGQIYISYEDNFP